MALQPTHPSSALMEYRIHGSDMQFIELTLNPGASVISETGSMMYMDEGVQMNTRMGDGSEKNSGIVGSIVGLAKRKITGENFFLSFFTNNAQTPRNVAFSAPYPGMIVPLSLAELGGSILCEKGSFLCASKGTAIGIGFTKRIGSALFGGEGIVLQKLEGNGLAFVHAGGAIMERELAPNERIYVDTGSIVAFQSSVDFNVKVIKGMRNMFFGGEELFLSTLTGPGKVWIQSMPYPRLIATMMHSMNEVYQDEK